MKLRLRVVTLIIGLAAAGSCSSPFSSHGPEITLYFAVQQMVTPTYVLRTQVGDDSYELTPDSTLGWTVTRTVRGHQYGTVPVRVTLFTSNGDSVVSVSLSQEYQRGFGYWVNGILGDVRPAGVCAGTVEATPLAAGSPDTLFVATGGVKDGAIC